MFFYSLVLTAFFVFVFLFFLLNVNKPWLLTTDNQVSNYIINNFRNKYLDTIFNYLDKIYIGLIAFMYFLFSIYYYRTHPGDKLLTIRELLIWLWFFIFVPLIISIVLSSTVKRFIKRKRPYIKAIKTYNSNSYSFPSIHASSSMTIVAGLFFLVTYTLSLYNYYPAQSSIYLLIISLIFSHISVCYSRIYLGVHYLSDVIGGTFFSLGIIGLICTIFLAINKI